MTDRLWKQQVKETLRRLFEDLDFGADEADGITDENLEYFAAEARRVAELEDLQGWSTYKFVREMLERAMLALRQRDSSSLVQEGTRMMLDRLRVQ